MDFLISLLFDIFQAILLLLPASPFVVIVSKIEEISVLGVVNWFIPFDNCLVFLEIWATAMITYYVVENMEKVLEIWSKIVSFFK